MSTDSISTTQEFECSLLTYNLWGLPVWVPRSNQRQRFTELAKVLAEREETILCLQETFSKKLRQKLIPRLQENFHVYSDYNKSKRIAGLVPIDQKGGLMTLSKYPIVEEQFFQYPLNKKMRWEERFARKGFIWTKIKMPRGYINIINTHLYASGNNPSEQQRLLQIQYMEKVLDTIPDFYKFPTMLLGDINICHPYVSQKYPHRTQSLVYDYLLSEMNFIDSMPDICDDDCTIHCDRNHYVSANNDLQKLDYCFLHIPDNYTHEIIHQAPLFDGMDAMSDHLAWYTKIKWKKQEGVVL